jgi:predicted amidohydrolase YtcJ
MRAKSRAVFVLITLGIMACQSSKMKVDLLVTGANVCTLQNSVPYTSGFVVKNGRIVELGDKSDLLNKYIPVHIVDVNGRYVYPGFYDAHCHFYGYGTNLIQYADLAGTSSKDEVYEKLKIHQKNNKGDWLLGRGWDQNDWPEKNFPDKAKLDELFPDIPVFLIRIDGHAAWCNSRALKLAGVTPQTKVAGGEVILHDGRVTGVLIYRAKELVSNMVPGLSHVQKEQALIAAQRNCFSVGLTSVTDCGLDHDVVMLMDSLQQTNQLKMRVHAMLNPTPANVEGFVKNNIYKTDRLHVNTIKLYADGALGSRGAMLLDDYADDAGNKGLMMNATGFYEEMCQLACESNYQVATHCIGDSANRYMLNLYAKFLKGQNDRRWRIEHAQVVHPDDFELFGKYSVVPSIQATHATSDMYWASQRLGEKRMQGAYAYQQLLQQNGWLPNGTDFPIEGINPLRTFYASVARKDMEGWPEDGFQMQAALTREQALKSITLWAARAAFEEDEKGSIEAGKWADFVVVDTNLLQAPENELLKAKVIQTFVAGELVYQSEL